jgi:hypothetical protein
MHHPSLSVTGCLHGGCDHSEQRGELGSREAVLQYLVRSHSVSEADADRALTEARWDSRYEVAEVYDGDRLVAVIHWNTQGLGEYTVEIPRKDEPAQLSYDESEALYHEYAGGGKSQSWDTWLGDRADRIHPAWR